MIYAPIPDKKISVEGVVDRMLATSPKVPAGAHKTKKLESSQRDSTITTEQSQSSIKKKATRDNAIRYESTIESGY